MYNYKFFTNYSCEYYPCHNHDKINCLFCFCPLYKMDCPGEYSYTEKGIKDCSKCVWIHEPESYDIVVALLKNP